jgi:SAM-dependent methyltransferase
MHELYKESYKDLIEFWKSEEKLAKIKGWDFSHLKGRWYDEDNALPWDYKKIIKAHLKPEMKILDIDTGGGEFVLSLGHDPHNISVTENYEPNFILCKEKLSPLGITVVKASASSLPFEDESFDLILNRHGDLCPKEIFRVLKEDGLFITQQVGAYNDRELVRLILPKAKIPFPDQILSTKAAEFESEGFEILEENEAYHLMRFYDVGALVWFAKIIEWEFPNFSVSKHVDNLIKAHELLSENEYLEGKAHRFYFVAQK